jgi:hypothetical protein
MHTLHLQCLTERDVYGSRDIKNPGVEIRPLLQKDKLATITRLYFCED